MQITQFGKRSLSDRFWDENYRSLVVLDRCYYTQGRYIVKRLGNPKTDSYRQAVAIESWSLRQV